MEDQTHPKRCGHITGKSVIPADEMAGKIRAAIDARRSPETMIIARTDAIAVSGIDDALERGNIHIEAGADALFIEAPENIEQMRRIAAQFAARIPLVHNFVEGGKSPITNSEQLETIGYKIGLFPLAFMHAAIPAGRQMLKFLFDNGETSSFPGNIDSLPDLNEQVDLQSWLDASDRYS